MPSPRVAAIGEAALRQVATLDAPDAASGRFGAYLQAALDALVVADASGCVVEFNPAAEQIFGYSRDEALGKTLAELIVPPSLRERHTRAFARFIETGEASVLGRRIELTGMRADGSEFPVELSLSRADGEPLLICGALRDLSDAKLAADDLRKLAVEQAALRRLAMLVARQPSPDEVFTAVTEEVGSVLGADFAAMLTFDDRKVTIIASWNADGQRPPLGTRLPLDGDSVAVRIYETGVPARMDSYADVEGEAAQFARDLGARSTVGAPILVEGTLWGALLAATRGREPLPETAEARLATFTELVSTTISNAEARHELQRVGAEQEALRKAAVLVASGASPTEVFGVITTAAAEVFGAPFASLIRVGADDTATMVAGCATCRAYVGTTWTVPSDDPGITRTVLDSRLPSRIEDHSRVYGPVGEAARALGVGSVAGAPVIVDGSVWGVLAVGAARSGPPMAPDAAERVANFADLVSTAIGNTEAHDQVRRLLDEQAALRRVATLVARGVSPSDVFAAVTDEVGRLFGSEAAVARFEPDGPAMVVVGLTKGIPVVEIGTRWPLEDFLASTTVYRTGRPARSDHTGHRTASGSVAEDLRTMDFVSTVAAPIVVEGTLWGVMTVSDRREPLPPETEDRVAKFSELVATAIANAESRAELAASEARAHELASEQAALERVATLVAEGATPDRVFDAVRLEVARMFDIPSTVLMRFDADGKGTLLATYGDYLGPVGTRWPLEGRDTSAVARVHRTGRAARGDYTRRVNGPLAQAARRGGVRYPVAVPVVVEGALWGAMSAGSYGPAPPQPDLESRLAKFTELLAMAIANAESRADLAASEGRARALANEQSALRRVATLVAKGASADKLFAAVAREVADVVGIPVVGACRYEADGTFTMLGIAGETTFTVGSRWPVEDEGLAGMILATGRPARKDDYTTMPGPLGGAVRDDRMVATVGVPIVVDGVIWGFMVVAGRPDETIAPDTEQRLARFTELVATAISNATIRADLLASRARVLAAAHEARRRIERDLHDGAQQRLVTLAVELRNVEAQFPPDLDVLRAEVDHVAEGLTSALDELRELSRGIHPAILSHGGLSPALKALGRRSTVPVDLDLHVEHRLPGEIEVVAYYIVSEALANASKHANAAHAWVSVRLEEDDRLHLEIRDDGVGGADPRRGSGLIGLRDRAEALRGAIKIESPVGSGTRIDVQIPVTQDQLIDSPRPSGP